MPIQKIRFRQSGGFAGLMRGVDVAASELSAAELRALERYAAAHPESPQLTVAAARTATGLSARLADALLDDMEQIKLTDRGVGLPQEEIPAELEHEAEALLEKVGIADKRDHYPAHLSGGQQQRAAIARALAMRPQVLLLDEPTSALDPELASEVLAVIRALAAEGRTMLMVTHELGLAREVSTRVCFLHRGLIEEEGSPDHLFSAPKSERLRQFLSRHR